MERLLSKEVGATDNRYLLWSKVLRRIEKSSRSLSTERYTRKETKTRQNIYEYITMKFNSKLHVLPSDFLVAKTISKSLVLPPPPLPAPLTPQIFFLLSNSNSAPTPNSFVNVGVECDSASILLLYFTLLGFFTNSTRLDFD